ncbi:MAG: IMP dehydrogenase, partial [Chloroflexota bacterium]|nr:IMP dehydrogenase [Chloroflexota bacterium]
YALATKDANKQLKVLVAVESRLVQDTKDRIKMAAELGASGIVVDARQIYREHLDIARFSKAEAPDMEVILGNVVTREVACAVLEEAGQYIDGFRVGIGGGEVCITTETTGLGRALGSAIYEVAQAIGEHEPRQGQVGLVADGGIKTPLHIIGALGLGATGIMMGSGLAGFEESPTRAIFDERVNRTIKRVRGMGSEEAIKLRAGQNRYMSTLDSAEERFAEGIEKLIPYRGSGAVELSRLFNGVRTGFQGLGCKTVPELRENIWIVPRVVSTSKGML